MPYDMNPNQPDLTIDNFELLEKYYRRLLFKEINAAYRISGKSVDLDDLWQEARLALLKCIEQFDASKGVYFAVYLQKAVRNRTLLFIRNFLPHHYKKNDVGGFDRIKVQVDSWNQRYERWQDEL